MPSIAELSGRNVLEGAEGPELATIVHSEATHHALRRLRTVYGCARISDGVPVVGSRERDGYRQALCRACTRKSPATPSVMSPARCL